MKLHQLRSLCEVVDSGLSVSRAALKLHTVASGVSKQLRLLEDALGTPLLERKGTRITGITEAGMTALPTIRRILKDVERVRRIPGEVQSAPRAQLTIATTHINARYTLVPVFQRFMRAHPGVELQLRQGTPSQISQWVLSGEVDLGIGTAPITSDTNLVKIPCYEHEHSVIVPQGHPLLHIRRLTLEQIAKYPLIANYPDSRLGRLLEEAFSAKGVDFKVVIRATDPSVIKKYVEVGFGIAVLPTITVHPEEDPQLRTLRAAHLFKSSTACVIMAKGFDLPEYGQDFIRMVSSLGTRRAQRVGVRRQ